MLDIKQADRPDYDETIQLIVDYVLKPKYDNYYLALTTAKLTFFDAIGCGLQALKFPEAAKLIGPIVPGAELIDGVKVFGTGYSLEPHRAAFNIGSLIRWLDFNDTWLAAEWGHPSDNLGGIWAMAEYLSRQNKKNGKKSIKIKEVLERLIQAHEIQGVIALKNSFNKCGLDHVLLVRLASTATVGALMGLDRNKLLAAVSNAWLDGSSLRTYRHAPNAGSRKSWAAGDATARAVYLCLLAEKGEMGYPTAISAKTWGFSDVSFKGHAIVLDRPFASYVMENVLFKVLYPAEFHAQTAVECAVKLHPQVKDRLADIKNIFIETQEAAVRIIDKHGKLNNPADRDHCLQYMIAVPLIKGSLVAQDYGDDFASNPLIDELRLKMSVKENKDMSVDYLDPNKRAIGNSVQIEFKDGSKSDQVRIDYPIGHKNRRQVSLSHLKAKFQQNIKDIYQADKMEVINKLYEDYETLLSMDIDSFSDLLAR